MAKTSDEWIVRRSWSRPIGDGDLIARKKVDLALLNGEATVPADFERYFHAANDGREPEAGGFLRLELLVDGRSYPARLSHVRYTDSKRRDILQIRFEGNKELRTLLQREFGPIPRQSNGSPTSTAVAAGPDMADALGQDCVDFIRTSRPLVYRLELLSPDRRSSNASQTDFVVAAEIAHARRQGFGSDAATNKAIEMHAMELARAHFERELYEVDDVSANKPYDLECRRDDEALFVEVKGTQTIGDEVLLTRNEVEFARLNVPRMVLFIVSGIVVDAAGEPSEGRVAVIRPWNVEEGILVPYGYTHRPCGGNRVSRAE